MNRSREMSMNGKNFDVTQLVEMLKLKFLLISFIDKFRFQSNLHRENKHQIGENEWSL